MLAGLALQRQMGTQALVAGFSRAALPQKRMRTLNAAPDHHLRAGPSPCLRSATRPGIGARSVEGAPRIGVGVL